MDYINPDQKVAQLVEKYPQTYQVFKKYGCPDMRKGFFSLMAQIMSIRSAARIHRIPLDNIMRDLETAVFDVEGSSILDEQLDYQHTIDTDFMPIDEVIQLPNDFAEHAANVCDLDTPPATLEQWWAAVFEQFLAGDYTVEMADLYSDKPTRHEVHVNDRIRYSYCVVDALAAAVMEEQPTVDVRSIDPVAGTPVTFTVSENSMEVTPVGALICYGSNVDPEDVEAVGSFAAWSVQDEKCEVQAGVCQYTNAFESEATYKRWAAETESVTAQLPPLKVVQLMKKLTQKYDIL